MFFPYWPAMPDKYCTNCGAKRTWSGDECMKCGFKPQTTTYENAVELRFCRACGCVYAGACQYGHETSPYKPGR